MKHLLFIFAAVLISLNSAAQGNSGGKGKDKQKSSQGSSQKTDGGGVGNGKSKNKENKPDKEEKEKKDHENKVWDGTHNDDNDGPKPSKNQPAKVRAAFARDYPNVQNVTWSKYRGDWTATFRNGVFTSTAVYHANGERRDTRTPVTRNDVPGRVIDSVLRRRPQSRLEEIIKIALPGGNPDLFRIKEIVDGKSQFMILNSEGKLVPYNY
jgi:hypothetical protein